MDLVVGVDCGASHLRVGLFKPQGRLLSRKRINSPLRFHPDSFGERVVEVVSELINQTGFMSPKVVGLGIGVPGPIDMKSGLILPSANLGNSQPIEIIKQFDNKDYGLILIDRDTNVALLGEVWQGAARFEKNVVMLTLGTGVGGAVLINGELSRGENNQAGELGHIYLVAPLEVKDKQLLQDPIRSGKVDGEIPRCGLGHVGCLEAWIKSTEDLDLIGTYLGYGLANIVDIFNPKKVLIGGGMVALGDFLPKAVEVMKRVGVKPLVDEVEVLYATLGDKSGIYGAAQLVVNALKLPND